MRVILAFIAVGLIAVSAMPIMDELYNSTDAAPVYAPVDFVNPPNAGVGLRVTFLQRGLQRLIDIILYIINTNFREMSIPDQHMDENVPVVGHITLDITNIKVHNFQIPHGSASTAAPYNFGLNFGPGIGLNIHADWHWRKVKWPHLSGHGSVDITPKNGDINSVVQITPAAGHFHTTAVAVNVNFDKFDIKFHGGEAWLLNLVVKLLSSKLKKMIDGEIQKQVTSLLNVKLNEILAKVPTTFAFGGGKARMNVDVSLLQSIGAANYIDFGLPLQISSVGTGQTCPIQPADIAPVDQGASGRMLQVFIGSHFLNCALWTIYTNGILSHVLPSNTSAWALWIPAIYLKWPNQGMEEQLYMYKLGTVNLAPGTGVTGNFPLALNLTVLTPQGRVHAATLGVTANIVFKMWVAPGKTSPAPFFYLNVASMGLTLSVLDSSVGPIDLSVAQGLISVLSPILVKAVDDMLANGFPVPLSKGFSFVNPSIAFFNQYLAIETDYQYNPSAFIDPVQVGEDNGDLFDPEVRKIIDQYGA